MTGAVGLMARRGPRCSARIGRSGTRRCQRCGAAANVGKRGRRIAWVGCRHDGLHWLLFLLCVVVQLWRLLTTDENAVNAFAQRNRWAIPSVSEVFLPYCKGRALDRLRQRDPITMICLPQSHCFFAGKHLHPGTSWPHPCGRVYPRKSTIALLLINPCHGANRKPVTSALRAPLHSSGSQCPQPSSTLPVTSVP